MLENVKEPLPFVLSVRVKWLFRFTIVTCAPGMTALSASATVPVRVAVLTWAPNRGKSNEQRSNMSAMIANHTLGRSKSTLRRFIRLRIRLGRESRIQYRICDIDNKANLYRMVSSVVNPDSWLSGIPALSRVIDAVASANRRTGK